MTDIDLKAAAQALGKRGGSVTSDRKKVSSAQNGKKGGAAKHRPRYCEMCDQWMKQRTCPACGMPTRIAEKGESS